MIITDITIWRVQPPTDVWHLLSITTKSGLVGWGEFTGSGHDTAAAEIIRAAADGFLGSDALDLNSLLAPYRDFRYPPAADKVTAVAWSALAQALWDIRGQAFNQPLCRLLGGTPGPVRLYANLNRGLFRDRSPSAHGKHAELAVKAGFAVAKCTPFDDLTPTTTNEASLAEPLERLRSAVDAVGSERIAIDCHCRFSPALAARLLPALRAMGNFAWVEDLLAPRYHARLPELHAAHPEIVWGTGEETLNLAMAADMFTGETRPDIFMPDIKYICGLDEFAASARLGMAKGCLIYPHNPSGPVSLAFSAHMAALALDAMVEYPYLAVPGQQILTAPHEPVEKGWYHLGDRPGLGIALSGECLTQHGAILHSLSK